MNLGDFANWVTIVNGVCTFFGYLPNAINKVRYITTKNGFEIKICADKNDRLNTYLNHKKGKDENKRCKEILKKHNLPKSVCVICKSEKDICFMPHKTIVDKTLNNLNLKSNDGTAELKIGGGYFALNIENTESGFVQKKIMFGTVIKHKGEIYLLRHPLGGYPHYLARIELFINGMIIELDDNTKIGLYYF